MPPAPLASAIASLTVGWELGRLGLQCSVVTTETPRAWHAVHADTRRETVRVVESWFGKEAARARYNDASLGWVARHKRPLLARHAGFTDLFVPIVIDGGLRAFLVSGPFFEAKLSAGAIARAWEDLSGRRPSMSDPQFTTYLRVVLDTIRLSRSSVRTLVRLLETLARVVAGEAAGPEARRRLAALYARLREGGAVARVWDTAEGLVDRWTNAIWLAEFMRDDRAAAGLQAPPTIALAVAPRQERGRAADGIELAIRGHDLQRRCVALARAASDTVCGRLPGGGVFLLARTKDGARAASIRLRMAELAGKVRRCGARELGLDLRVGVGTAKSRPEGLPESFDEALLALQCGMQAGRAVTFYMEIAAEPKVGGLYAAVRALRDAVASGSTPALEIGCDRLLRDAMVASRGDRGRLAAYLESALYRLVEVLERREVFDPRQLDDLVAGCRHALEAVHSVYDLPRAFAAKVAELAAAVSVPARSRRDAKLERARRFIEKNFDGPLPRARAAREAGLSPDYFASLFKQHVGMGFEAYLIRLRLERAAELLRTTDLAVKQIAREAGFGSYPHFFHAWKKAHGITPLAHRAMKSVLRIAE